MSARALTWCDGSSHYQRSISLDFRPKLQHSHAMQLNSYMPTLRRQHVQKQQYSAAKVRCSRCSDTTSNRRQKFVRERKDPAKMTNSRRALSRRGLGIRPASAKSGVWSHSASIDQTCAFNHQAFGRSSAHLARKPSTRKNSNRKSASARSGLEPMPCSRAPSARACTPRFERRSAR